MKEKVTPETPPPQVAITLFANPMKAHEFMCGVLWPDGKPKCPHCGSENVGKFSGKRMVSNCKACKKQFTVKIGTIFGDSPLPLSKWLPAVWLIVNAKNGISSYEIGRSLGVTQKTGWFMLHRIRLAMQEGFSERWVEALSPMRRSSVGDPRAGKLLVLAQANDQRHLR